MTPNNLIRQIIRESVRKRLGLISEAVTVKNDQIEMTVTLGSNPDGSGDSVEIKNKTVEDITSYGFYGSDNEQGVKPLTSGDVTKDDAYRIKASAVATFAVANGSLPVLTPQSVLTFSCVFEGGFKTFVKADTGRREAAAAAAANAETSTAPGVDPARLLGYFGAYKIEDNSVTVVAKRSETVAVKTAGKDAIDLVLRAGEKANFNYEKGKSVFIYRKDYTDSQPYDLISNGAVTTKVGENEVDPKAQSGYETAGADPKGEKTDAGSTAASSAKPVDGGAKKGEAAKGDASLDPQAAAATVQDKIKTAAMAVNAQFDDLEEPGAITLDDVKASNNLSGHVWISNSDADRNPYKLSDWSAGSWGSDKYTYFALVEETTGEPVAFVVASDPETNKHFSTGRYIGPTSQRQNLRRAFCKLYHRATGRPHETCDDGSTTGPEDDFPKSAGGGRGGKGKGSGGAGSGRDAGAGGGAGDLRTAADVKQNAGSVTGRGDVKSGTYYGVKALTSYEKVRNRGKKFITKTMNEHGFQGFPIKNKNGQGPRAISVHFNTSVVLKSGEEPHTVRTELGEIKESNILKIKYGFVGENLLWTRIHKIKPGDKDFKKAAAWVLANREQFNLLSDNDEDVESGYVDDAVKVEKEIEAKGKGRVAPAENKGEPMGESAVRRSRQTMSITPLFDRYRF